MCQVECDIMPYSNELIKHIVTLTTNWSQVFMFTAACSRSLNQAGITMDHIILQVFFYHYWQTIHYIRLKHVLCPCFCLSVKPLHCQAPAQVVLNWMREVRLVKNNANFSQTESVTIRIDVTLESIIHSWLWQLLYCSKFCPFTHKCTKDFFWISAWQTIRLMIQLDFLLPNQWESMGIWKQKCKKLVLQQKSPAKKLRISPYLRTSPRLTPSRIFATMCVTSPWRSVMVNSSSKM